MCRAVFFDCPAHSFKTLYMFDPRKIQLVKNVQHLAEFGGSMRQAIKAAGYSQEIADNPNRITDRKWFQKALPNDDETSQAIHELLHAAKLEHYVFPLTVTDEEIKEIVESIAGCRLNKIKHMQNMTYAWYHTPDNKSKKEAIDIILKVKGQYSADKLEIVDPLAAKSPEELLADLDEVRRIKAQRQVNNGQ